MKCLVEPDKYWGPPLVKHRVKIVHLKKFDIDPDWIGSLKPLPKLHGQQNGVYPLPLILLHVIMYLTHCMKYEVSICVYYFCHYGGSIGSFLLTEIKFNTQMSSLRSQT